MDDLTNAVDSYKDLANNFVFPTDIPRAQSAAGDLADRLREIKGQKAWANAGAAFAVTVPNEVLPSRLSPKLTVRLPW